MEGKWLILGAMAGQKIPAQKLNIKPYEADQLVAVVLLIIHP